MEDIQVQSLDNLSLDLINTADLGTIPQYFFDVYAYLGSESAIGYVISPQKCLQKTYVRINKNIRRNLPRSNVGENRRFQQYKF